MKLSPIAVPCLAALLVASGANAQQSQSDPRFQQQELDQEKQELSRTQQQRSASQSEQQRQQQRQQQQATQSEASAEELKVAESQAKKEVQDINKASKVIGMTVMNTQNQEIGEVKDLVVDFESGKIAYVVISTGGFMGMGGKLIALPTESLRPMVGQKGFLVDAEKERVSQAPGFSEKNWPQIDAASDSTVGLSPTGHPSQKSGIRDESKSEQQKQQEQQQKAQQEEQ